MFLAVLVQALPVVVVPVCHWLSGDRRLSKHSFGKRGGKRMPWCEVHDDPKRGGKSQMGHKFIQLVYIYNTSTCFATARATVQVRTLCDAKKKVEAGLHLVQS